MSAAEVGAAEAKIRQHIGNPYPKEATESDASDWRAELAALNNRIKDNRKDEIRQVKASDDINNLIKQNEQDRKAAPAASRKEDKNTKKQGQAAYKKNKHVDDAAD